MWAEAALRVAKAILPTAKFRVALVTRGTCLAAVLLGLAGAPALGAQLTTIDPDAHYPEGPLWREGKLFYVEYSASNIKTWDGARASVYWHKDGCGASALIDFRSHLLVACYDDNSLAELDASGKEVRAIRADSSGKPFVGPNDFAADGHGGIYFSASGVYDLKAPITGTVLHMTADGNTITEVANTIHYSNGLTLARDGSICWSPRCSRDVFSRFRSGRTASSARGRYGRACRISRHRRGTRTPTTGLTV